MFTQALDEKKTIIDSNSNEIVDLTPSIFSNKAAAMESFNTVKMNEQYLMRPDRASFIVYGDDTYADMVLKYSGISNPFSLCKDDILFMPPTDQIYAQLATDIDDTETDTAALKEMVKNYYKFKSTYQADPTSYDELEKKDIPSAVVSSDDDKNYSVPYISTDGKTAITIRNGRMYFGEDCGQSVTADLDKKIQTLIDCTATAINDQCAINGLSLTDFVRASTKNS